VAPGLIVERDGQSAFAKQPETPEELRMAWRARLLCPTASVRTEAHMAVPEGLFPEEMTDCVYRLGYNARASYGAHSYLMRRETGNVMVDSPRWAKPVVDQLKAWGGLSDILLTHQDDVADADRYARHFGARVWIHWADRSAARYADQILAGDDPSAIDEDLLAIPVPGHTRGSVAYLFDNRCLFTGDSLAWSFERNDLTAFRTYCWSWPTQIKSLERLARFDFEWVLSGHGGSKHLPAGEMRARLASLVDRMARAPEVV
jgi:glyoxylase-like metal-dependent hydrolase (beta-lactamase superfamily II)